MPVTKPFVLVLVVVLVLEFGRAACRDIPLRRHSAFTRGQTPIVRHSATPLPRLIEDEDDDEYEHDWMSFPAIPDLIQDSSTLI
jgi:hypothetical protein